MILKTSEKRSTNCDTHLLVISHLINNFHALNPFNEVYNPPTYQQRRFYAHEPSKKLYIKKFLRVFSRCVNRDVGVNIIS